MNIDPKIIEKLRKILAKTDTGRGATEEEVKTAMRKAQELAIAHNIDLSTVKVDGDIEVGKIETTSTKVGTSTKYERPYHCEILNVLQECLGLRTILHSYWTDQAQRVISAITFVGEKTDVALGTYCWAWLEQLFPKCWSEYRRAHGLEDRWVSSRSYYVGLRAGIINNNRRAVEELPPDAAHRYALVVVDKTALVNAYTEELFPKLKKNNAHQKHFDPYAYAAGKEKGATIRLSGGLPGASSRDSLNR